MKKNKDKKSRERFPNGLSLLAYELKGSLVFFIISMLLSAVVTLIDLINPRVVSSVIDYIIGSESVPADGVIAYFIGLFGGVEVIRSRLWLPALVVACAALAGMAVRYTQSIMNSIGAERFVRRIRNTLFSRVDRLSVPWYGENSTGDILQRCTSDVDTLKNFVASQLTAFARIILMIALSIAFMAGINVTLTVIAALFIPVIVGYSMYFHMKIGRIFMKADEQEGVVSSIVQENLTGIRVIRAFGKEAYECGRFLEKNKEYTGMWIKLMRLMSVFWSLGDLISGVQVMLVVILGAVFCVNGGMTAGDFVAFASYNAMLVWPVRELGRIITDLSRAGVSIKRIRYILNAVPEEPGDESMVSGADDAPLIEFRNVSFSYTDGTDALDGIDLVINKGEKIGIIGGTGSGKTTVADLMMRMADESRVRGTIIYKGKDISEYPLAALRRQFARVLQEPFLFSGTIADNIRVSGNGIAIDDAAVRKAAEDSALLSAAERFTDGLDTFVGERGVTLSGGQKQRCAIAAALAKKDAQVYIFDDAFSALDAQTEAQVRRSIYSKLADRTVVFISHRISTISGCDRIYVFDGGRIAAVGTHSELTAKEGIYRDIYELQK